MITRSFYMERLAFFLLTMNSLFSITNQRVQAITSLRSVFPTMYTIRVLNELSVYNVNRCAYNINKSNRSP